MDGRGSTPREHWLQIWTLSLASNLHRLAEAHLSRPLDQGERAVLDAAASEGLSVLQNGDAAARQQLLSTDFATALATTSAAQLWACCLDATEGVVTSVLELANDIVDGCSAVSGVLFAAAIGL